MEQRRWCTKEDVQEDLARATGQRVPDVDEGYFIYGERPPPPRICGDEDCEVELQLGVAGAGGMGLQPPPDLRGITKMLRMVQNYGSGDCMKDSAMATSTNDVIIISKPKLNSSNLEFTLAPEPSDDNDSILVSKLNPNVKEFIPRTKALSYSSQISKDSVGACNIDILSDKSNKSFGLGISKNNTDININIIEQRKVDEALLDQYQMERDELAAMLKSKIYSAPRDGDSFERRRHKYAAIADLLKLHCTPPPGPAPAPAPAPVKLRTPDYFANRKADAASRIEDGADVDSETTTTPETEAALHRSTGFPENLTDGRESTATEASKLELDPNVADESEVRASICKVNNWLNDKPCVPRALLPRSPAPHLGPVAYKRKQRPAPPARAPPAADSSKQARAPPAADSSKQARAAPAAPAAPAAYVPTAHARELTQQYARRAAPPRAPHVWERLQEDLERRDEELRSARRTATS